MIRHGDIQVMSAGSGIAQRKRTGTTTNGRASCGSGVPQQAEREAALRPADPGRRKDREGRFQQVLPDPNDEACGCTRTPGSTSKFPAGEKANYTVKRPGSRVYAFVIEGSATVQGQPLGRQDGLGVWDVEQLDVTFGPEGGELLLMDVPMTIS